MYVTKQGDMWDSIAKQLYGSEKHAEILIKANPQHADIVVFSSGIALIVPNVELSITSESNLPPWRI